MISSDVRLNKNPKYSNLYKWIKECLMEVKNKLDFQHAKILKKTNTLVFLFCELKCNDKIITSASGVWKIIKIKPSNLGPGG